MTNLSFSNLKFKKTVEAFRRAMPVVALSLLALTYLVAIAAEGLLLSKLMSGISYGTLLAFGISTATQATRALLVFFGQLNPNKPDFGYSGEIIAVVMGTIAIGSIVGLVVEIGMATPVAVAMGVLMLAGMGVEIFYLRAIKFATEMELAQSPEYWENMKNHNIQRLQFRAFQQVVNNMDIQPSQQDLTAARNGLLSFPASISPTPHDYSNLDVSKLSTDQKQIVSKMMEENVSPDTILKTIELMKVPQDIEALEPEILNFTNGSTDNGKY